MVHQTCRWSKLVDLSIWISACMILATNGNMCAYITWNNIKYENTVLPLSIRLTYLEGFLCTRKGDAFYALKHHNVIGVHHHQWPEVDQEVDPSTVEQPFLLGVAFVVEGVQVLFYKYNMYVSWINICLLNL